MFARSVTGTDRAEHFDDLADVVYVGQQIDEPLAPDPLPQS
jgi:hypothetical protein